MSTVSRWKIDRMAPPGGSVEPESVLYGLRAVQEALRARARPIRRVLVIRKGGQFTEIVNLAREAGVPVHVEPRPALDRLVPSGKHQGVVGLVGAKAYSSLEEILDHARGRAEPPLLLILDEIEDPHNVGAVLRTAEGAGAHGIVMPGRRSVGLTSTVAKVSAGALDHLRVACATNLARAIDTLKEAGLWVYALDAGATKLYTELDLRRPMALVLGSEGRGVRPGILARCDERAVIPMRGRVASLNVSASAAIVLYETVRQRSR